jgi:hypothetical protein
LAKPERALFRARFRRASVRATAANHLQPMAARSMQYKFRQRRPRRNLQCELEQADASWDYLNVFLTDAVILRIAHIYFQGASMDCRSGSNLQHSGSSEE